MPNFSDVLGLAVTFAAACAFMVEPALTAGKKTDDGKSSISSEHAAIGDEYEAIFLFSLLGLLVTCALLPYLMGDAALGLALAG